MEELLHHIPRALYDAVIVNNPDPVVVLDTDSIIRIANTAVSVMFGYANQKITGKRFWDQFVSATDSELADHAFDVNGVFEMQTYHKKGRKLYLQVKTMPIFNEGRLSCTIVSVRDLTKLVESKTKYKTLLNASPEASFVEIDGVLR